MLEYCQDASLGVIVRGFFKDMFKDEIGCKANYINIKETYVDGLLNFGENRKNTVY